MWIDSYGALGPFSCEIENFVSEFKVKSDKDIKKIKTGPGEEADDGGKTANIEKQKETDGKTSTGTSLTKSTNKNIRKVENWIQKFHGQATVFLYKSDSRSMQMADSLKKAWVGRDYVIDNNNYKE